MEVEARNKQEAISEDSIKRDKGEWNDTVQLLVAKLLAFKRGLNGVGDDRAQLPPVDMSDPFPTEMAIYLNSIVDDYVAVIDGAKGIMSDQRENSKTAEGLKYELISEASWWGSRTWARLGLLGLGEQRKIRIKMLAFANESVHDLYNIENDLSSRDPNGVAKAVNKMLKLMNDYNHSFVPQYHSLMAEMQAAQAKKFGPKKEPKKLPEAKPEPSREPREPEEQEVELKEESEEVYSEEAPKNEEISNKYKKLKKGLGWLQQRIKLVRSAKSIPMQEKTDLDILNSNFISALSDFESTKGVNATPDKATLNKAIIAYAAVIKKVKEIQNNYYKSEKDMEADIDPTVNALTRDEITKLAHSAFTRYMNRAIIGFSDNKLKTMKFKVISILLKAYKAFDELMDRLEERKTTPRTLSVAFLNVSSLLTEANKKLWPVGKNYILSQDERNRELKQKGKKDAEPVRMLREKELKELGGYSARVLGAPVEKKEKTSKEMKEPLNKLKSEIEPIFNGLNVNMHPGGMTYDVKQLIRSDSGETVIGIVVKPNTYIKKQQAAQQSSDPNVLAEWQNVKNFLNGKFKDKIKKRYKDELGYPITIHILE